MKSTKDFETFLNSLPEPEKGQAEEILREKFERLYEMLPLSRQGGMDSGDYCEPLIRYLWKGFKALRNIALQIGEIL